MDRWDHVKLPNEVRCKDLYHVDWSILVLSARFVYLLCPRLTCTESRWTIGWGQAERGCFIRKQSAVLPPAYFHLSGLASHLQYTEF